MISITVILLIMENACENNHNNLYLKGKNVKISSNEVNNHVEESEYKDAISLNLTDSTNHLEDKNNEDQNEFVVSSKKISESSTGMEFGKNIQIRDKPYLNNPNVKCLINDALTDKKNIYNNDDEPMVIDVNDDELIKMVEEVEYSLQENICDNTVLIDKSNKEFYSDHSDPEDVNPMIDDIQYNSSRVDILLEADENKNIKFDPDQEIFHKISHIDDIPNEDIKNEGKIAEAFGFSDENYDLLGHHFNANEELVDKNGKKFEFNVYNNNKAKNQKRYEVLGEKITEYVYKQLEERCKLEKIYFDNDNKSISGFFFASKNAFATKNKLLILIHGSGVVRAGQWSRSVIINHSLSMGSQIPYIEKAEQMGFETVVLNTNFISGRNYLTKTKGTNSPEDHGCYVWRHYIEKSPAKSIAIVAHSYGGVVVTSLIKNFYSLFVEKVLAIAFTDSVHYTNNVKVNKFLSKRACNWVKSNEPIDTPVRSNSNDAKLVSAGDNRHEWTSGMSIESVFKYLVDMLEYKDNS